MAEQAQATTTATGNMRSEIAGKWSKFSATEIAALKSTDELVSQVASKYALDKAAAQKDVDTFANGRAL